MPGFFNFAAPDLKAAGTGRVILLSALCGFLLWALFFPSPTDNVESAQVLAGTILLPEGNPFRIYHLSVISLLVDGAAAALRLGFSPWAVSVLSSGAEGAVVFSGLTSCLLLISGSAALALVFPLLLLQMQLFSPIPFGGPPFLEGFHGHAYPILLANHPYIFGTFSLFAILLAWGLFGLGHMRSAGIWAGLMPWIHPVMAAACWLGIAFPLFLKPGKPEPARRRGFLSSLAGAALISLAALAAHRIWVFPDLGARNLDLEKRLVENFVLQWDVHRIFDLTAAAWMLEVDFYAAALAALILVKMKGRLPRGVEYFCLALLAVTAAGAASLLTQALFPASFPVALRLPMLHRWLNLNSMAFPLLSLGLLGHWGLRERRGLALALLAAAVAMMSFPFPGAFTLGGTGAYRAGNLQVAGLLFPLVAGGGAFACTILFTREGAAPERREGASRWAPLALCALAAVIFVYRIAPLYDHKRLLGQDDLRAALAPLSGREGLVALAHPTPLRLPILTQRAVLLDPEQIDISTYAPAAAVKMEDIFNNVYGQTMLVSRRPGEPLNLGAHLFPHQWKDNPLDWWHWVRRNYGVTDVVVPYGFPLHLPLLAEVPGLYSAYWIPDPAK